MITSQEKLEKVTEIVNGLDEHLQKSDAENRRRLPRVSLRTQLSITLLTGIAPTSVDVMTRNISFSGIAFVCRRMFRSNERIAVLLRIPKIPPKLILARVTFGRYISGGMYEMGAEFLECISDSRAGTTDGSPARLPNHWLMAAGNVKTNGLAARE